MVLKVNPSHSPRGVPFLCSPCTYQAMAVTCSRPQHPPSLPQTTYLSDVLASSFGMHAGKFLLDCIPVKVAQVNSLKHPTRHLLTTWVDLVELIRHCKNTDLSIVGVV